MYGLNSSVNSADRFPANKGFAGSNTLTVPADEDTYDAIWGRVGAAAKEQSADDGPTDKADLK